MHIHKLQDNVASYKGFYAVDLWPWMTLKVSSIYLQCYHDHFFQIWAKSEHFENLTSSWPLTLDDLESTVYLQCCHDHSCQIWAKSGHFKIWPQINLSPWMTSKVSLIYSECYWDRSCLISAQSEQFDNLTLSWPLTLDDLESKYNLFTMLSWSFLSNLSQIRSFWQSDPKLTFYLGWPQK